jgi:anaerobic magnesium-protoporphyrin IX monomethyl ester cyclase
MSSGLYRALDLFGPSPYKRTMQTNSPESPRSALKIALIYPCFLEARIHAEEITAVPLGLFYVGAMLKAHGYEAAIFNWHAADRTAEIEKTLDSFEPDILAFSIVHANRWGAIDIARIAKRLNPRVRIVFGGIGATFLWHHLLTHFSEIDFVIRGEGEIAMLALVRALEAGTADLTAIPNLAWRGPHGITKTALAPPVADLDALPTPARYFDYQHLSMTRGCPGRCTFCGSPRFWGRRVRSHSVAYMLDQLELLTRRGTTFFYLSDDTFTLQPKRVIELCRGIVARGLKISWQAISKVNTVNAEMLRWMRKAGCVQISYGIESGAPAIRHLLCKDIDEDQILRAFELTVRHGILARAYFIYGAPGENDGTITATLDLIRRIRPLAAIFYVMTLFPGTELYEDYRRRSGSGDDVWLQRIEDLLYFETDPVLSREQVLGFGHRLRTTYHSWLPEFAARIELADDPELCAEQADFLSRLGLTFSHGDYARLVTPVKGRETARRLFERALTLHPDQRAFWGLALLDQEAGAWQQADQILRRGLAHHPDNALLNLRFSIGLMQAGDYHQAIARLLPFQHLPDVQPYLQACRRSVGKEGAE